MERSNAARVWILGNQIGRRNLSDGWRIELALQMKELLAKKGRETMSEKGKEGAAIGGRGRDRGLSEIDNPLTEQPGNDFAPKQPQPEPKHDTREQIAKAAGVSTGKVGMAEVVRKRNPELRNSLYRAAVAGYGGAV